MVWGPAPVQAPGSALAAAVARRGGLVALGVLTFVNGVLAARGDWSDLALVLVGDAVLRTGAILVAVAVDSSAALPWAIAVGALAWLPLVAVRPPIRATLGALGSDPVGGLVRRAGHRHGIHGVRRAPGRRVPAAALGPARARRLDRADGGAAGDPGARQGAAAGLIYGFWPAIMRAFLDETRSLGRAVARWWLVLGVVGGVATLLAAAIGPEVVRAVFGDQYATKATDLAALTGGSVLIGLLVVSGLALVAADRHTASTTGWLALLLASASTANRGAAQSRSALLAGRCCSPRSPGSSCTPLLCARPGPWPVWTGHRRHGSRPDLTSLRLGILDDQDGQPLGRRRQRRHVPR